MKTKIDELREKLIQLKSDHDYLKPSTAIDLLDIIEKQHNYISCFCDLYKGKVNCVGCKVKKETTERLEGVEL